MALLGAKLRILLVMIALLPFPLKAQDKEHQSTVLRADKLTITDSNILFAEGNVEVKQGSQFVIAERLYFDRQTQNVKLENIKEYFDGTGTQVSGKYGDLNLQMRTGIIQSANLVIDQQIIAQSDEIEIRGGEVDSATGIRRVTSCKT